MVQANPKKSNDMWREHFLFSNFS